MVIRSRISRRRLLSMSAAAGGLIAVGGHRAAAQPAKRIEQYAPELDSIISRSEPVQELASGTGGASDRPRGRCGGKKGAIFFTATSTTIGA